MAQGQYTDEELINAINQPVEMAQQDSDYSDEEVMDALNATSSSAEVSQETGRPMLTGGTSFTDKALDFVQGALPVVGGITGAITGAGSPLSIPLAGFGAAGGEGFAQTIQELRGKREQGDFGKILWEGAAGLVGEGVGKILEPVAKTALAAIKGAPKGLIESAGLTDFSAKRLMAKPELINKIDEIGNNEYINQITSNLQKSVGELKTNEINKFNQSLADMMELGKNTNVNIDDIINSVKNKAKDMGIFAYKRTKDGFELGTTGKLSDNARNLLTVFENIKSSSTKSLPQLQKIKSEYLDSVIDWTPSGGRELNPSELKVQGLAKDLRADINSKLNNILGSEYSEINKTSAKIQDLLGKPEIRQILYNQNPDLAANAIKLVKTRPATKNSLMAVDDLLRQQGIKSPNQQSIIDDLLDYSAAREATALIRTGSAGGLSNLIRRGAVLPAIENIGSPIYKSGIKLPELPSNLPRGTGAATGTILDNLLRGNTNDPNINP